MLSLANRSFLKGHLRDLPLRYRLIVPFFLLALVGTSSLVILSILSQNTLIRQEERERLFACERGFDYTVDMHGRWAVSLAAGFARSPEVASALAERDRLRLIKLSYPAYLFMKDRYKISQFNFHTAPPRNFLRLQRLYEFGDDLAYRQTIVDAVASGRETYGLESGLTGYGIRGVVPVWNDGKLAGTIEIGFSFGTAFLDVVKSQFGVNASLLIPGEDGKVFRSMSTTFPEAFERKLPEYARVFASGKRELLFHEVSGVPYAMLIGAVKDYRGETVALVEFCMNRTSTLEMIHHYRLLMLGIGILGLLLSVGAIYLISAYFTRPIGEMVAFARRITLGQAMHRFEGSSSGELGILAKSLDDMLVSLLESQEKIRHYAENLEQMVHTRTRALLESEEKYRTLVENVPLVVYRLLGDGRTVFINQFIQDLMGVSHRQVLENTDFWKQRVMEDDRARIWPLMDRCLQEGLEFNGEYRIQHAGGRMLYVMDHAQPILDEEGNVESVDGFMLNVTDRHSLEQQVIQTEELRTLSEISERLAHEIRNPLVAAGGFARRMLNTLSDEDPNREKVRIIIQEVARLEKILEKTVAYLQPFEIETEWSSLNETVQSVLDECGGVFEKRSIELNIDPGENLPPVGLDRELFRKATGSMVLALADLCRPGSAIDVRTYSGGNAVHLDMAAKGIQVSNDDVEHFFYPFTSRLDQTVAIDLPMAKMIIHKHQGLIHLFRKDPGILILKISIPL